MLEGDRCRVQVKACAYLPVQVIADNGCVEPQGVRSMNAQLALMTAGTMITSGAIPTASAAAASTGISSAAVAVLEVASVINVTARQINIIKVKR